MAELPGQRNCASFQCEAVFARNLAAKVTRYTTESFPLDGANGVHIEILERSDTTPVIRWVEPGRCHYGEQRWRRRSAHTSGTCAVSRREIRRGDVVFKPAERPAPSNASAMISVEALYSLVPELQAA